MIADTRITSKQAQGGQSRFERQAAYSSYVRADLLSGVWHRVELSQGTSE